MWVVFWYNIRMEQIHHNSGHEHTPSLEQNIKNLIDLSLKDRFEALDQEGSLYIDVRVFVKNDRTQELQFSGDCKLLEDVYTLLHDKLQNLDMSDMRLESISFDGYAKDSLGDEVPGTVFFRRPK